MRNMILARISFRICSPIIFCISESSSPSMNSLNFTMDMSVASKIFFPPTVTARDSFLSRFPWQAVQGVIRMKVSYSALLAWEKVSRYLRFTFSMSPSKATS